MRRIARTSRGDLMVLVVTFVATITIALEVAIFVGMLASLFFYLNRTTHPALTPVAPDGRSPQRRFVPVHDPASRCPQTLPAHA
jgi:SulP family sulfate permease